MPKKKVDKKKPSAKTKSENEENDILMHRRRVNSLCKHNRKITAKSGTFKDPNFGLAGIDS